MKKPSFVIHPSASPTPELILRDVLENFDDTKAVAVIVLNDENDVSACSSSCTASELALMRLAFEEYVRDQMFGGQ